MSDEPQHKTPPREALRALLDGPPSSARTRIQEAIYWPNGDGYGMASSCATVTHAVERAMQSARLGYGADRDGKPYHRIHVTRITVETWEVPADLSEALRQDEGKTHAA